MTVSDPIADLLTRIRNGLLARKKQVLVPHSKLKKALLEVLQRCGFIHGFEEVSAESGPGRHLLVRLKYQNRESVVKKMIRSSRPGCRVYGAPAKNVRRRLARRPQHAVAIWTTSKGLLTDREATQQNVGGEEICVIW